MARDQISREEAEAILENHEPPPTDRAHDKKVAKALTNVSPDKGRKK